jgi:putative hydrolase of HD superfamily
MDNFQPLLLNDSNDGKAWRAHDVKVSQVMKRQERTKLGSTPIWEYSRALIEKNRRKGNLRDE